MSSSPEPGTSGGAAAPGAEDDPAPPPPLEVGASVLWRREGQLIPAEIVGRRVIPSGGDEYEYYVHCTDCEPLSISLSLFSPQFGTLNRVWMRVWVGDRYFVARFLCLFRLFFGCFVRIMVGI